MYRRATTSEQITTILDAMAFKLFTIPIQNGEAAEDIPVYAVFNNRHLAELDFCQNFG